MIDIVFNHTSVDCIWTKTHSDWYRKDPNTGKFLNTNPQWSDILELDLEKNQSTGLWEELISILIYWVKLGVDGFRCDVASIVPLEFWAQAKNQVEKINPEVFWLAESWNSKGVEKRRKQNLLVNNSIELHSVFHMTYDYDTFPLFNKTLNGEADVSNYLGFLRYMDTLYPHHSVKLRFVENHDTKRLLSHKSNQYVSLAWIGFTSFNRGAFLIYAGLESKAIKSPSKFEDDKINWADYSWQAVLTQMVTLKRRYVGHLTFLTSHPVITAIYYDNTTGKGFFGIFNVLNLQKEFCETCLPDGVYFSEISYDSVTICKGRCRIPQAFDILSFNGVMGIKIEALQSIFF